MDIMNENSNRVNLNNYKESSIIEKPDTIQFYADVEFGRPSKECANFGICRINPLEAGSIQEKKKGCCKSKTFLAQVTYYNQSKIDLSFSIEQMETACREKFFSSRYFKVEENYVTSFKQSKNGGIKFIEIKKGKYSITKTDETYSILFS